MDVVEKRLKEDFTIKQKMAKDFTKEAEDAQKILQCYKEKTGGIANGTKWFFGIC